jgi:hypothetical protein
MITEWTVEATPHRDAYTVSIKYAMDVRVINRNARSPLQEPRVGWYCDLRSAMYLCVWEPELRPPVRVETRCRARIGSTHCSFEAGHEGSHHSDLIGLWWTDEP